MNSAFCSIVCTGDMLCRVSKAWLYASYTCKKMKTRRVMQAPCPSNDTRHWHECCHDLLHPAWQD